MFITGARSTEVELQKFVPAPPALGTLKPPGEVCPGIDRVAPAIEMSCPSGGGAVVVKVCTPRRASDRGMRRVDGTVACRLLPDSDPVVRRAAQRSSPRRMG